MASGIRIGDLDHREGDAAAGVVDVDYFDFHLLAEAEHIGNGGDAFVRNFRYVEKAVLFYPKVNERPECRDVVDDSR